MKKLGVVGASIVGACAIHLVLAACSGSNAGSGGGAGAGTPDAFAQGVPAAAACAKWQVAQYYVPNVLSYTTGGSWPSGISAQTPVPDGWEPMGETAWGGATTGNTYSTGVLVFVRKCAQ